MIEEVDEQCRRDRLRRRQRLDADRALTLTRIILTVVDIVIRLFV
ncbi:hypothetical protein AB0G03_04515 [Micromonospora aurantiaca]